MEEKFEEEVKNEKEVIYSPLLYEELFYCFEKYMAVLCFKLSTNPNKSP